MKREQIKKRKKNILLQKIFYFKKFLQINLKYFNGWRKERKEYIHLQNLFKNINHKFSLDKLVVFNTVRSDRVVIDREMYLGKLLALNGVKVIILLDDGIMRHWEHFQNIHIPKNQPFEIFNFNPYKQHNGDHNTYLEYLFKRRIMRRALKTYKDRNLKIIYYSQIINKKIIRFENLTKLKKYAKSSTIRFFKTSELDYNDKKVNFYYNLSLKNALLARTIGEYILNEIKPDVFITSHGIYSTWGPTFEYLFKNGMSTLVYSSIHGHSMDPREMFFSTTRTYFLSQSKYWLKYKDKPVTEKMKEKVEQYMKFRQNYETSDTLLLYEGEVNTLRIDKKNRYKYHIVLFPNVIWDGNINDRHIIFKDYRDWILSTINYIKQRKDIKLYIKSHPSEITVCQNSPRIVDIIRNHIDVDDLENIVLIPPEDKINTYEFLKSGIDLGIVYDGFLAVELPFLKIPSIMCVKGGMFAVENCNFPINSREEYFNYLKSIDEIIEKFHQNYEERYNNLIKYLYWYLFKNAVKLPTLSKKYYIRTNLNQVKKSDLYLDKTFLKMLEF